VTSTTTDQQDWAGNKVGAEGTVQLAQALKHSSTLSLQVLVCPIVMSREDQIKAGGL